MKPIRIFISSVQKEFAAERAALRDYLRGDPLLRRFYEVFLFEDVPAQDRRADELYLDEVERCDIYLGLFGCEYGYEDAEGVSPTQREFDLAGKLAKPRLIYVKRNNDNAHPKMAALIASAGNHLIRRRFADLPELIAAVYASLVHHLENTGCLRTGPFDAAAARNATLDDISSEKIEWFLSRAHRMRDYALSETTPPADVLAHLNLLDRGIPNHAAILLFGKAPQRFLISSELKCMHFHTLEKRKPIPSYQIYKGTVFDLVDKSVDFVMSKLNRSVGTRASGPQAPVEYDIPEEVVAEGIVNAVAHRDYTSNSSVEVQLFPDRLEIWNPGTVHPPLTLEKLLQPHASQPNNPLIAEPLFLTKYIEKAGTGTIDMLDRCRMAGIRQPEFRIDAGYFILTLWRRVKAKIDAELPGIESEIESGLSRDQVGTKLGLSPEEVIQALTFCSTPKAIQDIQREFKWTNRTKFRNKFINPLLREGLLEMTIPDKPNSRLQKYRMTKKGQQFIAEAR